MRKGVTGGWIIALLCALAMTGIVVADNKATEPVNDWENPAVFDRNKEWPHAAFFPYPNKKDALEGDQWSSPFVKSLNGQWKFHLAPNPAERPTTFFRDDYDVSDWDEIKVPGNWEFLGCSYPIYTDVATALPLYGETQSTVVEIAADSTAFAGRSVISMSSPVPNTVIHYTVDGTPPGGQVRTLRRANHCDWFNYHQGLRCQRRSG